MISIRSISRVLRADGFLFWAEYGILSAQRDAGPNFNGQWVYEKSIADLVPGYL